MRRNGQSAMECAVLLVVVIAALMGMQRYVKAHLMGRWRATADTFGGGQQYEPGVTVVTQD